MIEFQDWYIFHPFTLILIYFYEDTLKCKKNGNKRSFKVEWGHLKSDQSPQPWHNMYICHLMYLHRFLVSTNPTDTFVQLIYSEKATKICNFFFFELTKWCQIRLCPSQKIWPSIEKWKQFKTFLSNTYYPEILPSGVKARHTKITWFWGVFWAQICTG